MARDRVRYEARQLSSSFQGNELRVGGEWRPRVNMLGRFSWLKRIAVISNRVMMNHKWGYTFIIIL